MWHLLTKPPSEVRFILAWHRETIVLELLIYYRDALQSVVDVFSFICMLTNDAT